MTPSQSTHHVMMIRPVSFTGNEQTHASNQFQSNEILQSPEIIQQQALQEFEGLVQLLREAEIQVSVWDDTPSPPTPDSIFPNNWVSFHVDGTVVLYPMLAINRRLERRIDVLKDLGKQGLKISNLIDLTKHEAQEKYLEGTGSMVLDRVNRIVYACLSPRTHLELLQEFAEALDYQLFAFNASDANGSAIYHTNVMLCIGSQFAVVCAEVIADDARDTVLHSLQKSGNAIVEISASQMAAFAGNMLELKTQAGDQCVVLSQSAFDALSVLQRELLQSLGGQLLVAPIPTIERYGGGSVRCMLAEIFLPQVPASDSQASLC